MPEVVRNDMVACDGLDLVEIVTEWTSESKRILLYIRILQYSVCVYITLTHINSRWDSRLHLEEDRDQVGEPEKK